MRAAFLFPGMVSQQVGMGKDLAERWPVAHRVFTRANEVLGYDFADTCFHGTLEQLMATHEMRWLTMYAISIASWRVLEEAGVRPTIVAGASGGIFASLVAAGSMSFEDGLLFLQNRGRLFETIPAHQQGTMLVIVTANAEIRLQVEAIARELHIQVALYNSPAQIVYAGTLEAIASLHARVRKLRGVYVPLPSRFGVVNAHHSPLLQIIQDQWSALVRQLPLVAPRLPVVLSSLNETSTDPQRIREALLVLNTGTVYWQHCFERLLQEKYEAYLEVGACQTLKQMARGWKKAPAVLPCGTGEELSEVLHALAPRQSQQLVDRVLTCPDCQSPCPVAGRVGGASYAWCRCGTYIQVYAQAKVSPHVADFEARAA